MSSPLFVLGMDKHSFGQHLKAVSDQAAFLLIIRQELLAQAVMNLWQ